MIMQRPSKTGEYGLMRPFPLSIIWDMTSHLDDYGNSISVIVRAVFRKDQSALSICWPLARQTGKDCDYENFSKFRHLPGCLVPVYSWWEQGRYAVSSSSGCAPGTFFKEEERFEDDVCFALCGSYNRWQPLSGWILRVQ